MCQMGYNLSDGDTMCFSGVSCVIWGNNLPNGVIMCHSGVGSFKWGYNASFGGILFQMETCMICQMGL